MEKKNREEEEELRQCKIENLEEMKKKISEKEINLDDIPACAYHPETIRLEKNGTMVRIQPPFMREIFGNANEDHICRMINNYMKQNRECDDIKVLDITTLDGSRSGYLMPLSKLVKIFGSLDDMIESVRTGKSCRVKELS